MIRVSSQLRGLRPLLASWAEVVLDYCRADGYTDNPWWYNERASLSTLAGAAWRLPGWSALEEFSTTKRGQLSGNDRAGKATKRGRCDLYVSHRSTSFAFEAKQAWRSIGKQRECDIRDILKLAKDDAGNLTADQADHRLGAVFISLYLPLSEVSTKNGRKRTVDAQRVMSSFGDWIAEHELGELDAYAYVAVRRCEKFIGSGRSPGLYPGVFLAIKRCKTGTRRKRVKA